MLHCTKRQRQPPNHKTSVFVETPAVVLADLDGAGAGSGKNSLLHRSTLWGAVD